MPGKSRSKAHLNNSINHHHSLLWAWWLMVVVVLWLAQNVCNILASRQLLAGAGWLGEVWKPTLVTGAWEPKSVSLRTKKPVAVYWVELGVVIC